MAPQCHPVAFQSRLHPMSTPYPDTRADAPPSAENEEQLRLAIEAADVGLWDVDLATRTLYWPAKVKAMFGISAHVDVTLDDFSNGLHPEDAPRVLHAFAAAQDPGLRTMYDVEYRTVGKEDGLTRWVAAKGRGLFDDAGRCVRAIGTVIDITARKQAEAEQNELRTRLVLLDRIEHATRPLIDAVEVMQVTAQLLGEHLDATRCAYADVEADNDRFTIRSDWSQPGVPTSAGTYSLELFGPQATSHLRQGMHLVVHDVDRELGDEHGGRMFKAIGIQAIVCAGLVKGGRLVAMMAVHQAIPRHWTPADLRLITDVVERCWAHIERVRDAALLREQDRRKDEFLATLAHELRNPLAPMLYAVALMKREQDPARPSRRIDVIERQAGHLVRLIDDLLDVSRINRGLIELKRETIDMGALMSQAVEAVGPAMESAGHRFAVHLPAGPAPVHADPTRLVQVLTNLLNNAAKYTPDGGDIRLEARVDGPRVIVDVADNGLGIAHEDQARVFQMFLQLAHTGEKSHGGLGIGLSLVKSLIDLHGGEIRVHSAGVGQGSTFRFELPLSIATRAAKAQPPATPGARRGQVLVVEDNLDGRLTLMELIQADGHSVQGAANGLEALQSVSGCKPDVVLLDLGMPGMDGYEVVARLRKDPGLAHTRVVALTGWGTQHDRARTRAAGFDDHLTKPVNPENLLALLNAWMRPEQA
ncbi:MAG: response regulator [Comamonadaceae bacterium]|nr:MAG: response regulator [Comamonadaceae bacterium]